MDRREFLVGTGLALGAGAFLSQGCARPDARAATPPPASWAAVKAEFGLAPDLAHMSGFFLTSHPRRVREAIDRHRAALDANAFHYIEDNVARLEMAVREAAARYLGGHPDEVAMTDSTTMGLGIVYGGLILPSGAEILTTTHDHIVTTLAVQFRAARGATMRQVPLYDAPERADAKQIEAALAAAIGDETRVVAVTWVHSGTGVKLPIRRLADVVARVNAKRHPDRRVLLCVDGVHAFGLEAESVAELGCDFFMAGCHKWLFGPRGTGIVWARKDAWAATSPTIPSMDPMWRKGAIEAMPAAAFMTPGGFHSFEHRWALDTAFQFHEELGRERVTARIHELNRRLKHGLAKLPRVRIRTPMSDEMSAGIVCFEVDGLSPKQVVERLRQRKVVASVTPAFYRPEFARLAAGLVTLEDDVDRAVEEVSRI